LPWRERKEHTIQHISTATLDERLIMCADKLHNISSMIEQYQEKGKSLWGIFNGDKKEQIWYYTQIVKRLKNHNDISENNRLFDTLEDKVSEFIGLVSN